MTSSFLVLGYMAVANSTQAPERAPLHAQGARPLAEIVDETLTKEAADNVYLLTKEQICHRLNISLRTLENWMQQKLVPYVKPTRTVRFIWADVEQALRENFGVGYPPGTATRQPRRRG